MTLQDLGFTILNKSKWFNGVTASYSGISTDTLLTLDFIKEVDSLQFFLIYQMSEKPQNLMILFLKRLWSINKSDRNDCRG